MPGPIVNMGGTVTCMHGGQGQCTTVSPKVMVGERPMRPEFGCAIHDYVFDNADTETAARVAAAVRAALRRWEPRIDVRDVLVSFDTEDSSIIYIDIRYALGETNDPRNLVFPFYVIPPETT